MSPLVPTQIVVRSAPRSARETGERSLGVVLTCTDCGGTYEPTVEDVGAGRSDCRDADCGGWTFWAELVEPVAGPTSRKAG